MSNTFQLCLASASPRRQAILKAFSVPFRCIQHQFDEQSVSPDDFSTSAKYVRHLAKQKALSTQEGHHWVLAADTIVVHQNRILGKPRDHNEAFQYLSALNNDCHQVMTAFCLYNQALNKHVCQLNKSQVCFNDLSDSDLKHYINTFKPFDKAGAYGIQEVPTHFIRSFSGSKYTIIGLNIKSVLKRIKHIQSL